MGLLTFIGLLAFASLSLAAKRPTCTFDSFCFYYTNGCTLAGCSPYKSLPNITCDECVRMCEMDQDTSEGLSDFLVMTTEAGATTPSGLYCKSITYNCETQTCNMYCDDDTGRGKLAVDSHSIYLRYSIENCPYTAAPEPDNRVGPPTGACPPGQEARIVRIDGYIYKPSLTSDKQFPTGDQTECARACLANKLPDGSSVDCRSAQYHSGQCILSGSITVAENSDNLEKDPTGAVFEKFCFDSNLVAGCDEIMEEAPQKVLVGLNKQTIDAISAQDCFAHCLNAQKDYGFLCNSGQFFPTAATQNCIINTDSKETRPDLFTDLNGDKATYFSPHCHSAGGAVGGGGVPTPATESTTSPLTTASDAPTEASTESTVAPTLPPVARHLLRDKNRRVGAHSALLDKAAAHEGEWSLWSHCHPRGSGIQVRFRQCGEKDPRLCEKESRPCGTHPHRLSGARPIMTVTIDPLDSANNSLIAELDQLPVRADIPLEGSASACRAIVGENGVKNCKKGIRVVDGVKRYCSGPVDC